MPDAPTWLPTEPLTKDPGALAAVALAGVRDHEALRCGTRLDEFEIVKVLGAGGFGIVYLAFDHVLLRQVAIKEYLPTALAGRGRGAMVSVHSAGLADTFALGLESFFDEARMLASFDHPSLVKVYRFWKANGTAYMVMPYYPGLTLKEARRQMGAAPNEAWLRALIDPLLGALEVLHGQGVYHRDIAPDNILLLPDGRPVLLDFGSARRVIGDHTQALTAIVKPNFAPVEQYADEAGMRQGPWTDFYALGATVHYALTGQAPTPAVLRAVRDALPALSTIGGTPYPGVAMAFLATIDWTMALAPDDRPQDVATVRRGLRGDVVPPPPSMRVSGVPRPAQAIVANDAAEDAAVIERVDLDLDAPNDAPARNATPARRSRFGKRAALAAVAMAGLGALGWRAWAIDDTAHAPRVEASAQTSVPPPAPPRAQTDSVDTASSSASTSVNVAPAAPLPTPVRVASNAARTPVVLAAVAPTPPASQAPKKVVASALPRTRAAEASAATATASPAAPEPALETQTPKDACANHGFFGQAVCIRRQCELPQWRNHPQCVEARRPEEQRQQRMDR